MHQKDSISFAVQALACELELSLVDCFQTYRLNPIWEILPQHFHVGWSVVQSPDYELRLIDVRI